MSCIWVTRVEKLNMTKSFYWRCLSVSCSCLSYTPHFLHLRDHHTLNYSIPPHMWIRHAVRNMSQPHLTIFFSGGLATLFTLWLFDYWSWQPWLSELPKSCQQWKLTFLSTLAFRATKIMSTVGVYIPFECSFKSYQNTATFKELTFLWISELPNTWKTLCFPSIIGVDKRNIQSYQNPVNSESWHSCRLQLSELPKFRQQWELSKSCQQWELTLL